MTKLRFAFFLTAFSGFVGCACAAAPTITIVSHSTTTLQPGCTISVSLARIDNLISSGPAVIQIQNSWLNVKNPPYNAKGDGVTDDRAAIVAAITDAANAGGNTVYFPTGNYAISNILYNPESVNLVGNDMYSSTISARAGYPIDTALIQVGHLDGSIYTTANPAKPIQIRNLTLDCTLMPTPSGNGTGQGYGIFNVTDFLADHVYILSSQGYGFQVGADDGTYGLLRPKIIYCTLKNCGRFGEQDSIGGANTDGSLFGWNTFIAPNGTSIDNVHIKGALWVGNRSVQTSSTTNTGKIWSDYGMVDSQIINNYLENGSIHAFGFLIANASGTPNNLLIAGNEITNGGSSSILVSPANQTSSDKQTSTGIRIVNNRIDGCVDDCIVVQDATGTVISGNITDNWASGGGTHYAVDFLGGPNTGLGVHGSDVSSNTGRKGTNSSIWYNEATAGGAADTNGNFVGINHFPGSTMVLSAVGPISNTLNYDNGSTTATGPLFLSSVTTTGKTILQGTVTNDNADSNQYGFYISSTQPTATNFPATTNFGDGAAIVLGPGDWDVTATIDLIQNGATGTNTALGISSIQGNSSAGLTFGDTLLAGAFPGATNDLSLTVPNVRVSLSAQTTYYLKVQATFSAGTPQYKCRLSARKPR